MDTATQASGQASQDDSVIVPTSEQDGQPSAGVSFNPTKQDAAQSETNDDAKKQRISNEEWQRRTEAAEKGQALQEKVKETLGVDNPNQLAAIAKQLSELKEESKRKDWEIEHPASRSEKYRDKWAEASRHKLDPESKYYKLDYDEIWKIIRDDSDTDRVSKIKEELKTQDHQVTVPLVSKASTSKPAVNPETLAMLRSIYPNITEKEAAELG